MNTEMMMEAKEEAYQVARWEREIKNQILKMSDGKKKQEAWSKYFMTRLVPDDSYLEGNIF